MKKLYKSRDDKLIDGVLSGISDYFGIDPLILRIAAVIFAFLSQIIPAVLLYIVLAIVMKEEPSYTRDHKKTSSFWKDFDQKNSRMRSKRKSAENVQVKDVNDEDEWSDF